MTDIVTLDWVCSNAELDVPGRGGRRYRPLEPARQGELPVPPAVTVTLYVAVSPGVTVEALAFLDTETSDVQSTLMFTGPDELLMLLVSLLEVTVAVLEMVRHVLSSSCPTEVVGGGSCTGCRWCGRTG